MGRPSPEQPGMAAPSDPFVEILGPDGIVRRFATGTTASFAIDRINRKLSDSENKAVLIEAVREGEEPVEFGPDAELVNYGQGWMLQTVQISVKMEKTATSELLEFDQRKFLAELYPGGKLPEGGRPEVTWVYILNIFLAFGFIIVVAVFWVYLFSSPTFLGEDTNS